MCTCACFQLEASYIPRTEIEGSYAKKDEVQALERRVSRLENDPVGLNNKQMDDIFD